MGSMGKRVGGLGFEQGRDLGEEGDSLTCAAEDKMACCVLGVCVSLVSTL